MSCINNYNINLISITKFITEFEGCMNSLKFSFIVQSSNELMIIKNEIRQLTELLSNIHGVPDTPHHNPNKNFLME